MKKIMTEILIPHDVFKIKLGTLNKAYPDTIYLDFGTFISPYRTEEITGEDDEPVGYKELCEEMEKNFLQITKQINCKYGLFDKDFIGVFELASDRIKVGKKSYISAQYHFKPKTVNKLPIQKEKMGDFLRELFDCFLVEILQKGFTASKTKKNEVFICNKQA